MAYPQLNDPNSFNKNVERAIQYLKKSKDTINFNVHTALPQAIKRLESNGALWYRITMIEKTVDRIDDVYDFFEANWHDEDIKNTYGYVRQALDCLGKALDCVELSSREKVKEMISDATDLITDGGTDMNESGEIDEQMLSSLNKKITSTRRKYDNPD